MGIDYGQKRTGIAVTDAGELLAFPRQTIQMQGKDAFFAELLQLAEAEQVEAFVVGLPIRQDGTDSETTRQVRNMLARLKRRTTRPVYVVEETLSSWDAEQRLREAALVTEGRSKVSGATKTKLAKTSANLARLDQAAAVIILETFLALPLERRIPL